jgi:hypothetical protein
MPKATVYKHGDALPREDDVNAAWHLDSDSEVLPETHTPPMEG